MGPVLIKNSFGRRRDFRVKMWGTSSPDDKLTGDLRNVIEAIQIGGRRSDRLPAGGPTDIVARVMAQWLSERLGQQFVVENRPGAASNIGTEAALRAPPDGYTLLQVTSSNAVNATFYENLNFNFLNDIRKHTRSQGPSLRRHYPTSTVVRPCPTPADADARSDVEAATLAPNGSPPITRWGRIDAFLWPATISQGIAKRESEAAS